MTSISIAAYLTLFAGVAIAFLFVALLLGRFFRPHAPNATKLETYECGEPAVGSSYVQFDLRFYVVALVFIIFEVEVAFFFPWATVFGKSVQATARDVAPVAVEATCREFGLNKTAAEAVASQPDAWPAIFRPLALASMADIAVFFGVLLVGFAYLWRQGDLNWVRAVWTPGEGDRLQGGSP